MNDEFLPLAISKFKELHWKKFECCQCGTTEDVKKVEIWCDPYCGSCLDKALKDDTDDLYDSIDETEDYSY